MNEKSLVGGRYARYVLWLLVVVYILNFVDRQILSILAEDIKRDIGVTDAELGFLYGTAFAIFYAVFGIPLGKLADTWSRGKLIAIGLSLWSLMTALSGTARCFSTLALYRIGVGIGEASASPAAYSLLSDYFPPRLRATVFSIYTSGVYIGAGIGLFLGGWIVTTWNGIWPDAASAPLSMRGWQVAFMAVGLPGLLVAAFVWKIREPGRGLSEGLTTRAHDNPFLASWQELMSIIPPLTLVSLYKNGAGARGIFLNMGMALSIVAITALLVVATGSVAQWATLGVGLYAVGSWVQALALRDRSMFIMLFGTNSFVYSVFGFGTIAFVGYGFSLWVPPYFFRAHAISPAEAGTVLGLSAAIGGWFGVTTGGVLTDMLKSKTARAPLVIARVSIAMSCIFAFGLLIVENLVLAYAFNFLLQISASLWPGASAAAVNDLVMPRMRAVASALYLLIVTFFGLALGPFVIGHISDSFSATGIPPAEALRNAMLSSLLVCLLAFVLISIAARHIETDLQTRLNRARALGEPV